MSRIQVTWVVKTRNGQIKGPYSTEAILKMISEGAFTGSEMISKMPDGKWTLISKESAFYDKLLEALEGVVQVDPEKAEKMDAETVIMPPPASDLRQPETPLVIKDRSKNIIDIAQAPPVVPMPSHSMPQTGHRPPPVIDLKYSDNYEKSELLKRIRVPLIALVILIVAALWLFTTPSQNYEGKISLLAPGKGAAPLGEVEIKQKLASALSSIEKDTFDSYLNAQNQLVALVEGAPMNLEVRALLCVVYKELWPFAKQDSADLKVISAVTQSTKALNVVSPYGNMCDITKLLTAGRYKEARGIVENTLENADRFSLLPVLYSIKGELLAGDKDTVNAMPYYEKATQL